MAWIKVKTELKEIAPKIHKAGKGAMPALTMQVVKDGNLYAPMDTGNLMLSALIHSNFQKGEAVWMTPYARRWYYSSPIRGFQKARNPRAQSLWGHKAIAEHSVEWYALAGKLIKDQL